MMLSPIVNKSANSRSSLDHTAICDNSVEYGPASARSVAIGTAVRDLGTVRVAWAARALTANGNFERQPDLHVGSTEEPLQNGDLIATRIIALGKHRAVVTADNRKLRLYRNDILLGVAGGRYASDAYEAQITPRGPLHLITGSGMCATVLSRHRDLSEPTELELLGRVHDQAGPVNLIARSFQPRLPQITCRVVLMLGSGMNAGKTTTSRRLIKSLLRQGLRVSACKLTGSVSHRDLFEYESTDAHDVRDFSQYGFPSTYGCSIQQLEQLFLTMVADAQERQPDVIVMEIADGVLQQETAAILASSVCWPYVAGTVLAAPCSLSSLQGVEHIERYGHRVLALSGLISNSPLMIREFSQHSEIPFASSANQAIELASRVIAALDC